MSEETSPVFFVRFSNNRRKYVEYQNKKFTVRKNNFIEFYGFNFIPIVITSTILSPLNRLKTLMQIRDFIPSKDLAEKSIEEKNLNLRTMISSKIKFLIRNILI